MRRQGDGQRAGKTFATARGAVAQLEHRHGPRTALWTYHDAHGEPVGVVVRWDRAGGGKDVRPASRNGDGWHIGGMPEPRPLYGLPDLNGARRVFVCEGEKTSDAARSIGLTATTSAHGSQSPEKTDWQPLAGKEVVLLPDNDLAGRKYADAVAAILAKMTPAPVVKVVELPGLTERGDLADFVAAHAETDCGELRRVVEGLADEAKPIESVWPAHNVERFEPFPVDALPGPVRGFVAAAAKAIGCDPSYVALPALAVLASAIGTTYRIGLKQSWNEPAVLWTVIVGESGTLKTPALDAATAPLIVMQSKAIARWQHTMEMYEQALLEHQRAMVAWKRSSGGEAPGKPDQPVCPRCVVSDITVEALAQRLAENPRGVLVSRDELSGWLRSFDRYKSGRGADVSAWLEMHNAGMLLIDRKGGAAITHVTHAAVSITGGIQPSVLRAALSSEHFENGLAARLLLAMPTPPPKRWTEADVDPAVSDGYTQIVTGLLDLQPGRDDEGSPRPRVLGMTPEAKAAWVAFYNDHAAEQENMTGALAAAWSKLEGYAARLALVLHLAAWAGGETIDTQAVDERSMRGGIALAKWFAGEVRRVYAVLSESDEARDQRRLVELIVRRGGAITPRELCQSDRRFRGSTEDAELALNSLVQSGLGAWTDKQTGGRPSHVFHLSTLSTSTKA